METDGRTLYKVLGIAEQATPGEIKVAWRQLMLVVHPDQGGTAERTHEVQAAYEVLSDPERRGAYDRELAATRGRSSETAPPRGAQFDPTFDAGLEDLIRRMERTAEAARRAAERRARAEAAARESARRASASWGADGRGGALFCGGITRKGEPCRARPLLGSSFCYHHHPSRPASRVGDQDPTTGSYRAKGTNSSLGAEAGTADYTLPKATATSRFFESDAAGWLFVFAFLVTVGVIVWSLRQQIYDFTIEVTSWVLTLLLLWWLVKFMFRRHR